MYLLRFNQGGEKETPPEIFALRPKGTLPDTPGWEVRVVPNKFPALTNSVDRKNVGARLIEPDNFFKIVPGKGHHEVIVESPKHIIYLEDLPLSQIEKVLLVYQNRYLQLKNDKNLRYILIFKNCGERTGASLEHTHSQLMATPVLPKRISEELNGAGNYYETEGRCIFCDLIKEEKRKKERLIKETESFILLSPFASRFAFEMMILPKRHISNFEEIKKEEVKELASLLKKVLLKMGRLLNRPSYNYLIHTAPLLRDDYTQKYHWHIELFPRLTEIGGFEWGTGSYINSVSPEKATEFLKPL